MNWITLAGWIGPVIGGGIGLLGGVFGTWCAVRNTRGPRERSFAIKASVLCWIVALLFVAGMVLIPAPYNLLLTIPYFVVLVFAVRKWNEIQFRIQKEESDSAAL